MFNSNVTKKIITGSTPFCLIYVKKLPLTQEVFHIITQQKKITSPFLSCRLISALEDIFNFSDFSFAAKWQNPAVSLLSPACYAFF